MEIQDPREKFDFDCTVFVTAIRIEKNGYTKTPEQELEDYKSQFAAAGWTG